MPLFERETHLGSAIQVGETRLFPISRTLKILPKTFSGGLIWNRPLGILAQTSDGKETIHPIDDLTRRVQIFLLGAGLIIPFLIWQLGRKTK